MIRKRVMEIEIVSQEELDEVVDEIADEVDRIKVGPMNFCMILTSKLTQSQCFDQETHTSNSHSATHDKCANCTGRLTMWNHKVELEQRLGEAEYALERNINPSRSRPLSSRCGIAPRL